MALELDESWDGALKTYIKYFNALEVFDLDAGIACFSRDVEYWRPPLNELGEDFKDDVNWHQIRGHEELRGIWEMRGPQPQAVHHLSGFARNGNLCFCEGFTPGDPGKPPLLSWVSVWEVDANDLIKRYMAYGQAPLVTLIGTEDIACI